MSSLSVLKAIGYRLRVYTPTEKEFESMAEKQCLTDREVELLLKKPEIAGNTERLSIISQILEAFPKGTEISVFASSEDDASMGFWGKVVGIKGNEIDGISLCTYQHYNFGFQEVKIDPKAYGTNGSFTRPEEGEFVINFTEDPDPKRLEYFFNCKKIVIKQVEED